MKITKIIKKENTETYSLVTIEYVNMFGFSGKRDLIYSKHSRILKYANSDSIMNNEINKNTIEMFIESNNEFLELD